MTDSTALVELEKRLAEATGPDREIDARLTLAVLGQAGFVTATRHSVFSRNVGDWAKLGELARVCDNYEIPTYTASIDATFGLAERVLGRDWIAELQVRADGSGAQLQQFPLPCAKTGWFRGPHIENLISSTAIALLLALVRALQSQSKREAGDAVS